MDELALLRDFRLEDAAADGAREHARAALQRAMTRRRLPRRRYAVALAFALAAVLAAAAYAIVHQFVIGSAAPKDVQDQIGMRIAVVGGNAHSFAGPGPLQARGAGVGSRRRPHLRGPCTCSSAGSRAAGNASFSGTRRKRTPKGMPITSGACGFGKQRHARGFGYAYNSTAASGHPYTHRGLRTRRRAHPDRQALLQDAVRLVHRGVSRAMRC